MADENTTGQPQAGDPAQINPQPQAGTPSTEPQAGDDEQPISLAEAKKLRSEARSLRERLKAAEGKATELDKLKADIETANLSEKDKLQKQYNDLKTQHDEYTAATLERTINYEVRLQAAELGVNPKHLNKVARFVAWEDIETDEEGNPTNIKDVVEALIKEMPELVGGRQAPLTAGGATSPSRSSTQTTEITDAFIAALTPATYAGLSPEMRSRVSQYMQSRGTRRR